MELTIVVERVIAWMYLVMGLSLLFRPRMWLGMLDHIRTDIGRNVFLSMFVLVLGLVVVVTHNDWTWRPGIVPAESSPTS